MFKKIAPLLLFFTLLFCAVWQAYAQAPVIYSKTNPVVKLDATGKYVVKQGDVIDHIQNLTDSPLVVSFNPASFDCSTSGQQTVRATARTNGSATPGTGTDIDFRKQALAVACDQEGNIYVGTDGDYYIRKISYLGDITILAGSGQYGYMDGPARQARFGANFGIAVDSKGNVYVSETSFNRIRKISKDGMVSTFAGIRQGRFDGPANVAGFDSPMGLCADAQDNIYVADYDSHAIRKITPEGYVTTVATTDGQPVGVTIDKVTGTLYWTEFEAYINDPHGNNIKMAKQGGPTEVYAGGPNRGYADGPRLNARFEVAYALVRDDDGNIFVSDYAGMRVIRPNGMVSTLTEPKDWARGLSIDPCGNIILAAYEHVSRVTRAGVLSRIAGGGFNIEGKVAPSSCQGSTVDIPLTVQSTPVITTAFNDVVVTDCSNLANYAIKAQATDNCPNSDIKFTQTPEPNTPLQNNVPVVVTVTATDKTGGSSSVSFNVTAKYGADPPGTSVQVSASAEKICAGDAVTFTANVVNADNGTTYQWLVNGRNAGPNASKFTALDLKDGDVVNCAATSGKGCGIPNIGLPVTIYVAPKPAITLKPSEDVLSGSSITLDPTVTGDIASFLWTPETGLSDARSQFPVATSESTTVYKLTVTSVVGCTAEAEVIINVTSQIVVPNAFTPNGDGKNDTWNISKLNVYGNCSVTIYNRYGSKVFQSTGYPKPWDGTVNGSQVPAGIYYYIIDLHDGSSKLSGNVSVLR